FVARRLRGDRVGMLVASRPENGAAAWAASWLEGAARLRLSPFSPAVLHGLIKERLAKSLSRPTLLRLHRMSGGNAFFALELARALVERDLVDAHESWPVPDDLQTLVELQLRRLPGSAREALLLAAAAAQPTTGLLGNGALE